MSALLPRTSRSRRAISSIVIAAAVAVLASACSSDNPSSGDQEPTANASQASTALDVGLAAHAAGDLDAATTAYNKVLSYDPTNKFAFYNLALIDETDSNYGLAEAKYRSALTTDPAYEPALFNLAILRTSVDPTEATALYERAVAADDQDAAAWLNLGLLQRASGNTEAGDVSVLRAISINPELTDPAPAVELETPPPTTSP